MIATTVSEVEAADDEEEAVTCDQNRNWATREIQKH